MHGSLARWACRDAWNLGLMQFIHLIGFYNGTLLYGSMGFYNRVPHGIKLYYIRELIIIVSSL